MNSNFARVAAAGLAVAGLGRQADAGFIWHEVGDAPQTLPAAQAISLSGVVSEIRGTISTFSDADMYKLVFNQPGTVTFSYNGTGQLALFNSAGVGLAHYTDPGDGGGSIPGSFFATVTAGSEFYVSMSLGGVDPRRAGDNKRLFSLVSGQATGPVLSDPFDHFGGTAVLQSVGDYTISFESNMVSGTIPSGGGLGVFALGGATLLGTGRTRGTKDVEMHPIPSAPTGMLAAAAGGFLASRRRAR